MNDEELTPYQRGNRDGLISFSKWIEEQYELYAKDAHDLELKACENGMLSRADVRRLINNRRYQAQAFLDMSKKAKQMSESLPIDPQEEA
jgi:hypothetical protein